MPNRTSTSGSELFIVDNSDQDWKVVRYLHDWCQISKAIDVASGYFEIGSLLSLKDGWQKVDKIRILMGDEVTLRTKNAFAQGLRQAENKLDQSIEAEKQENDFLAGVPAIVEAIRSGKIECRLYRKEKFHAKTYITHARLEVVGSSALVGSSNFTYPGLHENIELNVQITGRPVTVLQEWYEEHWNEAEDVTSDILKTIERHTALYSPFDVYARSLHEFFRRHEMTDQEWLLAGHEKGGSRVYPILDYYQQEGFHELLDIREKYHGAFLCDGVGLGKTFIGLMVIESLILRQRKRVALFVPKAARKPVWEKELRRYLPNLFGEFSNLAIYNHTDLLRGGEYPERLKRVKDLADVIVIDEAHHFRNPGIKGEDPTERKSHYWQMYDICAGKDVFLLTATPVNNRLLDLQHMMELFTQRQTDYFKAAPLGVHSLPGHFRKMEKTLEKRVLDKVLEAGGFETNQVEAEQVLSDDSLFRALVVQRSRAYVQKSQEQHASGSKAIFPTREAPRVVEFNLKKTYGRVLDLIEQAFSKQKPLFSLAIYYPLAYYKGPDASVDQPLKYGRQKEVVSLIRIQFLKRFESSARAFELSCAALMEKLLAWLTKHCQTDHEKHRLERWKNKYADLIGYCQDRQLELFGGELEDEDEDIITPEMLEAVEELSRDEYKVEEMIDETIEDLHTIADFLQELQKFRPEHDDKLKALVKLLKTDPVLKKHKVLIFTEFMATARYLRQQLAKADLTDIDEVDSAVDRDRGEIINQFAPYYNESSTQKLNEQGLKETRILISTDVLSEGLNLQDATRLINYDLHWNPVRLMQRIGRVDRRLNPEIEALIAANHPDRAAIRGKVAFWNFLPPDELEQLLRLYARVAHKTLRISRTFGIEGKKLLTPEDDYEALKDFTHAYEGTTSAMEEMNLEYQKLLKDNPGLVDLLEALPGRVFSGKQHPKPDSRAVFFCYALPSPPPISREGSETTEEGWVTDGGATSWYLYDLTTEVVLDEPTKIIGFIRCMPDSERKHEVPEKTLSEIRVRIEKHIKNTYLKQVQAPVGVKATLKAWMELS
jgi:superfamily II DNA or RNA helicase/HKD family nuclease